MNTIFSLPMDIYKNRRLVAKLAKNDFKTRYAGSYLGIVWAFIQPVITILVYWFVFSVGFRSGTGDLGVPFVLYLVAGIVPWFFFQDALMGGTNSLLEYNYLVKKVVFNISVLPVVKIISAMFVHAFFVLFTIILYAAYGKFPDFYYLQIIYYSVCVFILVLGLSYATICSVLSDSFCFTGFCPTRSCLYRSTICFGEPSSIFTPLFRRITLSQYLETLPRS